MGSPIPRVDDLKDVECFKCHKMGHNAAVSKTKDGNGAIKVRKIDDFVTKHDSKAKSVRQIRIRCSDIADKRSDPFMRHWIILSNLGRVRLGSDNEGHLGLIFVDTGTNYNTISRKFNSTLLDQGLKCAFYPGPPRDIDINLVGGRVLGCLVTRLLS